MGEVIKRTALSSMIKERSDRSCAIFTADQLLVAQAEHLPIHLALLTNIVPRALRALGQPLLPGDVCVHNDPYVGGSHLPDVTTISAIYSPDGTTLLGYCAVIAHMGDIGGATPGGVGGITHDIIEEGLIIPPMLLCRDGEVVPGVMRLLKANVRTGREFEGDLLAQVAALNAGVKRVQALVETTGVAKYEQLSREVISYSARRTHKAIAALRSCDITFEDVLDDDGMGSDPLPIRARLMIADARIHVDFAGSAEQRPAPVNASLAVTQSAVFYAVRCLIDSTIPTTSGCFEHITVTAPRGSIVNAESPAPVAGGSLETAQRIVDVMFGAFAQLVPERVPAAGMGSHNTIAIGGFFEGTGQRFVLCENLSGGGGARATLDGTSARRVNLMNTPNTPVEVIEREFPVRILRSELRAGSQGDGRHRGGLGLRREYLFLQQCTAAILADRSKHTPWGLFGGDAAQGSAHRLIRRDGSIERLASKVNIRVEAGDRLIAETAGGGGYGPAVERAPQDREADRLAQYVLDPAGGAGDGDRGAERAWSV